jgi:hypothetical protein
LRRFVADLDATALEDHQGAGGGEVDEVSAPPVEVLGVDFGSLSMNWPPIRASDRRMTGLSKVNRSRAKRSQDTACDPTRRTCTFWVANIRT